MNYAEIKKNDIANGEGVRTSLFVSGCRNRCKNCFNAVTWDFLYGKPFDQAVENDIIESTRPRWISGLSLLGGEPFEPENQAPLLAFLRRFRTALPGKTVWCYTGFTLEELLGKSGECRACTPHTRELLGLIDILVDGRYEEELADITLAFRGSACAEPTRYPYDRRAGAVFEIKRLVFKSVWEAIYRLHNSQTGTIPTLRLSPPNQ